MVFGSQGRGELRKVEGRYSVGRDGTVYSDGLPLSPVQGRWVSVYGQRRYVSYLVARAWVPNPEGREFVRHRNGDPTDNRAENLEWSETKEEGRRRGPKSRSVLFGRYDWEGNLVARYTTVREAADATGIRADLIRAALSRGGSTGGWRWLWLC